MSTNYIRTLSRGWLIINFFLWNSHRKPGIWRPCSMLGRSISHPSLHRVAKCFLRTVIVLSRKATYILPHKRNNVRYILLEESILLKSTCISVARLVRWWTSEKTRSRVFGVTSAKTAEVPSPCTLYTIAHTRVYNRCLHYLNSRHKRETLR